MAMIRASVVIRRPVEDVFAFAADFRNDRAWRGDVRELHYLSDGPIGVGMHELETSRLFGRSVVTETRISVYEPNREVAFEYVSGPYRVRGSRYFEPVDGGTRLTFTLESQAGSRLEGLLDPVLAFLYQRMVNGYVLRLKTILESSAAAEDRMSTG